jgi:hypothetical protein
VALGQFDDVDGGIQAVMKADASNDRCIVSVTPMAVCFDSRTFKTAASFQRFGLHSTVVEAIPSNVDREKIPFDLISLPVSEKEEFSKTVSPSQEMQADTVFEEIEAPGVAILISETFSLPRASKLNLHARVQAFTVDIIRPSELMTTWCPIIPTRIGSTMCWVRCSEAATCADLPAL